MGGWLRRNGIALGAVVVLVPASVFVTFSSDWTSYYANRPSSPVPVASGESVGFGGAQWRVTDVQRIRSSGGADAADGAEGAADDAAMLAEAGAPAGTDVVVVELEVSDFAEAPGCLLSLQESREGRPDRSWSSDGRGTIDLVLDSGAEPSPICDSQQTEDYTIEALFVVPADTGGSLRLSVEVISELPRYLSVSL